MKYRIIKEDELRKLIYAANKYSALEQGGVDNWTWYEESCNDFLVQCSQDIGRDIEDFGELTDIDLAAYPEIEIKEGD